jgi:hypothetical protein|tara:strand:+ start:1303 stop:2073 length:771 start_codon:yes stop_codon:yes gene_type:complete
MAKLNSSRFKQTFWEQPIEGELYALGADPSEGLQHGDDSVAEVIRVSTGDQVAELQGKIEPFALAEHVFALGTYYNDALVGIENNRDGGANRALFEMGYKNIYFEMKEVGLPYQKPTAKLGYNMNARTRAMLVAQCRKFMIDDSVHVNSISLVSQFETFALESEKFQAIQNAHDDLVMAWMIACEMFRVQLMRTDVAQNHLMPLWNGEPVPESHGIEDFEILDNQPRSDRIIAKHKKTTYQERVVEGSTMGNLVGF